MGREIYYGWCLRYFHSSGASFVFLFVFLHLGRGIFYASYFYNPNTWFSGVIILLFLMGTAFMGYVLPFGLQDLIFIVGQEFTSHGVILLSLFILILGLSLVFIFGGVLASEALLFVSFFWASFHSLSSPTLGMWPGEVFYLPDPCELTFANTLLLSNA